MPNTPNRIYVICARESLQRSERNMGAAENKVEAKLCDGIKALGGKAYKFISPGHNGVPDRIICLPNGRVIFSELKSPKGVLSKQQKYRIAELRRMGQRVEVMTSTAEVDTFLQNIREEMICDAIYST